jgi:hypothetical protein
MRHGRYHAPDRQAQLPRQGSEGSGHDDEEGLPHRTQRPARARWWWTCPRTFLSRKRLTPAIPTRSRCVRTTRCARATAARSARRCSCCWRPSGRTSTPAAACSWAMRLQRTAHAGRHARLPGHQHADGPGRLPGERPQVPRHAGHARHHRGQQRDAELRRAAGRGRALRRPRDRQPQALRDERTQDHPYRHRPVEHLQAREGRHPDRRRREGCAHRADLDDPREHAPSPTPAHWPTGGRPSKPGASATASSTTAATRT